MKKILLFGLIFLSVKLFSQDPITVGGGHTGGTGGGGLTTGQVANQIHDSISDIEGIDTTFIYQELAGKQATLVSGTNIRTINGTTLLGSGSISTTQTTITGNSGSATVLETARTINGVSFNGSANITVPSDIAAGTAGNLMRSTGTIWQSWTPTYITTSQTSALVNDSIEIHIPTNISSNEIGFLNNLSSNAQSQIDLKANLISPVFTTPNIGSATGSVSGNAGTVTGFTPASGSLTLSGADAVILTTSTTTNVTLPSSGTLITTAQTATMIGDTMTARLSGAETGIALADSTGYATGNYVTHTQLDAFTGGSFDTTYLHYRIDSLSQVVSDMEGTLDDVLAILTAGGTDVVKPIVDSVEFGRYNDSIVVAFLNGTDTHQDSIPPVGNIGFTENGTSFGVHAVDIHKDSILIALDSIGASGKTYLLSYTKTTRPFVSDSTGNTMNNISARSVQNRFAPLVTSITVQGAAGATTIATNGGTLQMHKNTLPENAGDTTATWSVTNGTGTATISAGGLLTATGNGTVTVVATSVDGSGVYGEEEITISNQIADVEMLNNITFSTTDDWTVTTGASISAGVMNIDRAATWFEQVEADMVTVLAVSTNYRLTFTVTCPEGSLNMQIYTNGMGYELVAQTTYATGTYNLDFTTPGTMAEGYRGLRIRIYYSEAGTIDNISLKPR